MNPTFTRLPLLGLHHPMQQPMKIVVVSTGSSEWPAFFKILSVYHDTDTPFSCYRHNNIIWTLNGA